MAKSKLKKEAKILKKSRLCLLTFSRGFPKINKDILAVHQPSRVIKTRRKKEKSMQQKTSSSVRTLAGNAIIMALYVVLCFILPYQSGAIQFRLSESLNHLVVFNRKFIWGVFGGVVLYNLFFGYGPMDVLFGGAQTFLALLATIGISRFVKSDIWRLVWNCVFFTVSMFLIALMLMWTADLPFWPTYGTTALSEAIIMAISAPIMYGVNKVVKFDQRI
ncbi:hypothetical protein HMPREF9088_0176 [Enterococcus italicus DSM 15952]|uniref:QueT transporter n=2 Tax=Enterococcus italicus TaxID=246144 RepID=E6LCT6_ENTI1|nr:hypothetical protein HMPREF9088_0176 [Enterococcus italicus DSM 15952]